MVSLNRLQKDSVYIVIPVHNRKQTTLECLEHLNVMGDLENFSVVVVDDGSTDGTVKSIKHEYPDVILLLGDGNLWWTGAISLGMQFAYERGAEYIFFLNDDTFPNKGTIAHLLDFCQHHPRAISASQCCFNGTHTYGGQIRKRFKQEPVHADMNETVICDALDGNLVCLPRTVVDTIGYPPSNQVPHYGGDNLYTWLLKKQGYQLCLLGNARATCADNNLQVSWLSGEEPIWNHWLALTTKKSKYYPPGYWNFCTRYWGILGLIPFIRPYARLLAFTVLYLCLPYSWLRAFKNKRKQST